MSLILRRVSALALVSSRSPILYRASPAPMRYITLRSALCVSGYGNNPPPEESEPMAKGMKSTNNTLDPEVGGEVPVYSGPSIEEKFVNKSTSTNSSKQSRMKAKREQDFKNNEYEHDEKGRPGKKMATATKVGVPIDTELGSSKRSISISHSNQKPSIDELNEDTQRMKDKAKNKLEKGKLKAEEMGVEMKEGAEEVLASAKKMARKVKSAASSAAESVKSAASAAMTPIQDYYDDLAPRPNRISDDLYEGGKEDLYPTSDAANARGGVKATNMTPEEAAERTGDVIGKDVNSLRKSLTDGPQSMPQGVGKRAKSADGTPMEQGTEGA